MFKRYNILLFTLLFLMVLLLSSVGYINQPLVGDLTRIGGFRENDFGWNKPQMEYFEILYDSIEQMTDYNQYYDIIVLGDSFTFLDQHRSWLNYLIDKTGFKVAAFHQKKFEIIDIINSKQFTDTPPKLFIYQTVERGLVNNVLFQSGITSAESELSSNDIKYSQLDFVPLEKELEYNYRYVKRSGFEKRLSEAASYIIRLLKRKVLNNSKTQLLPIEKGISLFSSKDNGHILVSSRDFEKNNIPDEDIRKASKKIINITKRVQNNGKTKFLLLVVPDKLTVYFNWLLSKPEYRGIIERLGKSLSFIRVDTFLQEKVKKGVTDIYMPNDTHTSSHGNDLIAQLLVEKLAGQHSRINN